MYVCVKKERKTDTGKYNHERNKCKQSARKMVWMSYTKLYVVFFFLSYEEEEGLH